MSDLKLNTVDLTVNLSADERAEIQAERRELARERRLEVKERDLLRKQNRQTKRKQCY